MAKEKKYDFEKNEIDSKKFIDLIEDGKAGEAYEIFRGNPYLVEELKIGDIFDYYADIRRKIGDRPAKYFLLKTIKRSEEVILGNIRVVSALQDFADAKHLERLLEEIDDKYKQMLDEMRD